jgi:hypothetical protein
MKQLLEQKQIEDDVAKAFGVVVDLKDEKLVPLLKKLNISKVTSEKETGSCRLPQLRRKCRRQGKRPYA